MRRFLDWLDRHYWAVFLTIFVTILAFFATGVYGSGRYWDGIDEGRVTCQERIKEILLEHRCRDIDGRDYAGCVARFEREWGV
jgi:hypothetical protein